MYVSRIDACKQQDYAVLLYILKTPCRLLSIVFWHPQHFVTYSTTQSKHKSNISKAANPFRLEISLALSGVVVCLTMIYFKMMIVNRVLTSIIGDLYFYIVN